MPSGDFQRWGGNDARDALRLSKAQSARLATLANNIASTCDAAELGYRLGYDLAKDVMLLRSAVMGNPWAPATDTQLNIGSKAEFPISAKDLMPGILRSCSWSETGRT